MTDTFRDNPLSDDAEAALAVADAAIERLQDDLHNANRLLAAVLLSHGGAINVYCGDLTGVTRDMVIVRTDHGWGVSLRLIRPTPAKEVQP